jgi:hypothetical protein
MPTRILKRQWCKTCQDYKTYQPKTLFEKEWLCDVCETPYTKTDISEIPQEKIEEQRKRWTEKNKRDFGNIYTSMLLGFGLDAITSMSSTEIKEADAGQREIDDEYRKQLEITRQKQLEIRKEKLELKEKYKNLGRNDICICGSGKKYKKCCLTKISKIR